MWFNRFFRKQTQEPEPERPTEPAEPSINQGIYYLYLIIGCQVLFVLGLAAVIMVAGTVIATPTWVFLFAFLLLAGGGVYIYRKAKRKFRMFRESFRNMDLSDRNYEISFMGGVLTMRVEQNHRPMLEAPSSSPVVDADTVGTHSERQ